MVRPRIAVDRLYYALRLIQGADRVFKTGVASAWVHQPRQSELANAPEPLNDWAIQNRKLPGFYPDGVPDWVVDDFE
jgi:hypothetical protein